jgi:hypothetical protein
MEVVVAYAKISVLLVYGLHLDDRGRKVGKPAVKSRRDSYVFRRAVLLKMSAETHTKLEHGT